MCVTNIYVDLYPDGRRQEFRQTSVCQYGLPNRPCAKTSTLENPTRKIQWGEPTTEYMLTQHLRAFPPSQHLPVTPPRSSGGSNHRRSGEYSSSEEGRRRRSSNARRAEPIRRATREHKKERIIIVDSPPTPRTPPQTFHQVYTAPNSPNPATRGRPIIVDERPRPPPRVPSVGAVVGNRPPRRARSSSRPRFASNWDSPSSSHTSFDLQQQLDAECAMNLVEARRREERDQRIAELEAERRRAAFIAAQDEEIRRRPAVPLAPLRLKNRQLLRPVVDQTQELNIGLGGLRVSVDDRVAGLVSESMRRVEERERAARLKADVEEAEAMKQRLRERQMPSRRFSVGPAQRRHRVLYDDGVYRWE